MSGILLPLFPLQVVLFPDAVLPLHIFEERYKQLIDECLTMGIHFGINLVHEQKIAPVGCTAFVIEVTQRYADGTMDILVKGRERYSVETLVASPRLYSVARVKYLPEQNEEPDEQLVRRTIELHNAVMKVVYGDERFTVAYDRKNARLSYALVLKAGMELTERQRFLEIDSENDRLMMLERYFTAIMPKLEAVHEVERMVKSDGYLIR